MWHTKLKVSTICTLQQKFADPCPVLYQNILLADAVLALLCAYPAAGTCDSLMWGIGPCSLCPGLDLAESPGVSAPGSGPHWWIDTAHLLVGWKTLRPTFYTRLEIPHCD